jgi:FkbM family methyltransferase
MVGVDIGANLGYYALMEARLAGPTGRVIAIEPVPTNARILRLNAELNGYPQIEVHEMAISETNGDVEMWVTPESNLCNLLSESDTAITRTAVETHTGQRRCNQITVHAETLDSLLERTGVGAGCDFIRMDVEGLETKITSGMISTFRRANEGLRLFIEVHNDHFVDPTAVILPWIKGLLDLGFQPRAIAIPSKGGEIFRNPPKADFPNFLCSFRNCCPHILLVKDSGARVRSL